MAFSDVEMAILSNLAYRDIDYKSAAEESLAEVLKNNKDWLNGELGYQYEKYIDNLINKVDGSDYKIVASEHKKISGFSAYAIKTPQNEVVIACRGTQPDKGNDLLTDVGLGVLEETQQHRDMEAFVNSLEKRGYKGYYFTGHSLGGNLATHGATTVENLDKVKGVYTYNAPGFNEKYWIFNGWKLEKINHITNFQNEYDYVSSILRVPGRKVIIESSVDGNHLGILDHKIKAYKISENGYFQENETGKKHPQTYAGTAVGEAGNSFSYTFLPLLMLNRIFGESQRMTYIYRDFSDASKQNMLNLVTEVENEKWCNFTDWVGDRWYDFEAWIGKLDIRNYINNVNSYHKKVIDKNNTTKKKIEEIFTAVHNIDAVYGTTFRNLTSNLSEWRRFVGGLTEIVEPCKGRFNGQYMASVLNPILKDVSTANIQRIKDTMMQNVAGEPLFDMDLLQTYIRKQPSEMSSDEMEAVLDVISELKDTVTYYESAASIENYQHSATFWNKAGWVTESSSFDSFSAVSAHYNDLYVSLLESCLEQGKDKNTFAAALLSVSHGENALSLLGAEYSENVSKIFGKDSADAYVAKWKSEHSEQYFAKLEMSEKDSLKSSAKFNDLNKTIKDRLKDSDAYLEENETFYFDSNGNKIAKEDAPSFYKKQVTIAEAKKTAGVSASLYEGEIDVGENGEISITVANAEAHTSFSAGFYVVGADGEKKFSPGVNAEIGASVTALEAEWNQQWLGDENFGLNSDVKVTVGQAEAKANATVQVFGEDGALDLQFGGSAKAEATAAKAEGAAGVNILGGEIGVRGSVSIGVGAHAEVGYRDGVFKFDIGVALGVGVSVGAEINVGGMVDTVCDVTSSSWSAVSDGWNSFWGIR